MIFNGIPILPAACLQGSVIDGGRPASGFHRLFAGTHGPRRNTANFFGKRILLPSCLETKLLQLMPPHRPPLDNRRGCPPDDDVFRGQVSQILRKESSRKPRLNHKCCSHVRPPITDPHPQGRFSYYPSTPNRMNSVKPSMSPAENHRPCRTRFGLPGQAMSTAASSSNSGSNQNSTSAHRSGKGCRSSVLRNPLQIPQLIHRYRHPQRKESQPNRPNRVCF